MKTLLKKYIKNSKARLEKKDAGTRGLARWGLPAGRMRERKVVPICGKVTRGFGDWGTWGLDD
jgi:hypothetical protein